MTKYLKKILHDNLSWGYPDTLAHYDAFQSVYTCKFCDGRITLDSQGNWFHLDGKEVDFKS